MVWIKLLSIFLLIIFLYPFHLYAQENLLYRGECSYILADSDQNHPGAERQLELKPNQDSSKDKENSSGYAVGFIQGSGNMFIEPANCCRLMSLEHLPYLGKLSGIYTLDDCSAWKYPLELILILPTTNNVPP